jgi:hydrogenase maturation protease
MKILFFGYGNPGRQDDGAGIIFIDRLMKWVKKNNIKNIFFDSNYQLNIEDSAEISEYDIVIFVDSTKELKENFKFSRIFPIGKTSYTSHNILPENILFLSKELYNKQPETYLITIKGYKWGINEKPTKKTLINIISSIRYIKKFLKDLIN